MRFSASFWASLALPNLARDSDGIRRNAAAVSALFEKRGVRTRLLEVPGAPPAVYGEIPTPGAARTVIFYAHYDGQPLDPKEWATPPWEPVIRDRPLDKDGRVIALPAAGKIDPEWRIYARSASDDKAPLAAITTALDALKAAHIPLRSNIKFIFEGEEEGGSPHLAQIIVQVQRAAGRRRLADLRRPGAPEPPPADRLRRAGRHQHRDRSLRTESRTAQRPLRQLGAQPGDGVWRACSRP